MSFGKGSGGSLLGSIGAIWGVSGVSLIFGSALFRLYPHARELFGMGFGWVEWAALAAGLGFVGYAKGYGIFHRSFSPRFAARALYLKRNPTLVRILLAPLFCMGYFHATRKRKTVSLAMTSMVVGLILLVRKLDQPWRGIVDAGVLTGLGWGLVSIWLFTFRAFFGKGPDAPPETP